MKQIKDYLGIIPARIGSTRLPGKPLIDILGKPLIQYVYEAANKVLETVVIATDSPLIFATVEKFGGNVIIVEGPFESGTDRCFAAYTDLLKIHRLPHTFKGIINIQGDQPLVQEQHISKVVRILEEHPDDICTIAKCTRAAADLESKGGVFVTLDGSSNALYFSRRLIPYVREGFEWPVLLEYFKHIGIYGYTIETLKKFCSYSPSYLEATERLEQLRWLENGGRIKVALTFEGSPGVDTFEDVHKVIEIMETHL